MVADLILFDNRLPFVCNVITVCDKHGEHTEPFAKSLVYEIEQAFRRVEERYIILARHYEYTYLIQKQHSWFQHRH